MWGVLSSNIDHYTMKTLFIRSLKPELSEKPKIIGIRQLFVILGVFLVWGASDIKHFAEEM